MLFADGKSLRDVCSCWPSGDDTPQEPSAHRGLQTTRGRVAPQVPPPSLSRRVDFMPAVGGPAAFVDGTAPALTARRRTQKSDMTRGGCLFGDRDRIYMAKLLRIVCILHS